MERPPGNRQDFSLLWGVSVKKRTINRQKGKHEGSKEVRRGKNGGIIWCRTTVPEAQGGGKITIRMITIDSRSQWKKLAKKVRNIQVTLEKRTLRGIRLLGDGVFNRRKNIPPTREPRTTSKFNEDYPIAMKGQKKDQKRKKEKKQGLLEEV